MWFSSPNQHHATLWRGVLRDPRMNWGQLVRWGSWAEGSAKTWACCRPDCSGIQCPPQHCSGPSAESRKPLRFYNMCEGQRDCIFSDTYQVNKRTDHIYNPWVIYTFIKNIHDIVSTSVGGYVCILDTQNPSKRICFRCKLCRNFLFPEYLPGLTICWQCQEMGDSLAAARGEWVCAHKRRQRVFCTAMRCSCHTFPVLLPV